MAIEATAAGVTTNKAGFWLRFFAIFIDGLGVGIVLGLGLAIALTRVMRALLYDVEPTDAVSVSAVAFLIVIVAAAASWWPARRAMKVDPLSLLREE